MSIKNTISLLAAPLALGLLSACVGDDSILDGILPAGSGDIIRIGGIDNPTLETAFGGYATRAVSSRATAETPSVDAETVPWLLGPLFGGLDITYGAKDAPETEKVAILRLLKKDENFDDISASNIKYSAYDDGPNGEKIAEYSFRYREAGGSEGDYAKWYDNGLHYFQGVYVPDKLRFAAVNETPETVNSPDGGRAPSLKLDQSQDVVDNSNANYTLLERYLGMPADAQISATVGRVKLPFRHRLARVLAYVLIDPTMGADVTINGYKQHAVGDPIPERDDASTTDIRFCNVDVLAGVEQSEDASGHAELTPKWAQSRKVIPHFVGERASLNSIDEVQDAVNFIMFYDTEQKTYIFPANDDAWLAAREAWNKAYNKALPTFQSDDPRRESKAAEAADEESGFKRTLYGKVPCYDLIVRPTYTTPEMVMYDEEGVAYDAKRTELANKTNNIDFEITLSNGLKYDKEFSFDLDANFQTIVYLRINREHIDYNSSGAEVWKEITEHDDYYGVNNQNGNTLSYAGSSWQRAYRIGSTNPGVTDGHYYGKDDSTDDDAVQDDDQMRWYPQYVSQAQWTQMFAEAYLDPTTGKKGLHHGDYFILDSDITIDARQLPDNFIFTGHLDGQDHTITLTNAGSEWFEDNYIYAPSTNYDASPIYVMENEEYVEFHLPQLYTYTSNVYYTDAEAEAENLNHLIADSEGRQPGTDGYVPTYPVDYTPVTNMTIKTPGYHTPVSPSLAEVMNSTSGTYRKKIDNDTYSIYTPPTAFYEYVNQPIPHTSGSTLFAGLNGTYAAAVGEANVHSEKGKLVPYVDADSKTGWRAEVINVKISGADMFPAEAIDADGNYDVNKVSGYIYNCWRGSEKVKPHTPTLPKYN